MNFSTTYTEIQTEAENTSEAENITKAENTTEAENKTEKSFDSFGSFCFKKHGMRRAMSAPPLDSLPYKKRNIKLRSTSPPATRPESEIFDTSDDNFVPNSPYISSNEFSSNEFATIDYLRLSLR